MHYNFQLDLEPGEEAERRVVSLFESQRRYPFKFLGYNKDYRFDVLCEFCNQPTKLEVKADLMSVTTGNFVFEYHSRGKDTGITTTESDYWIQQHGERFMIWRTPTLRDWLFTTARANGWYTRGGDRGSNTKMFKVAIEESAKCSEGWLN